MLDPDEIYQRLVKEGEAWADALEIADMLEETKKSLLSQLGTEIEGSATSKESYAFRHEDYKKHIKLMVTARKAANKARVRYDSARVWSELIRTKNANERAANRVAI